MHAGSRPGRRGTFVSAKVPKTMLTVAWPFGCPAPFTGTGGGQTRFAHTLPACSPVPVPLLGHATRPGEKGQEHRLAKSVLKFLIEGLTQGPPIDNASA